MTAAILELNVMAGCPDERVQTVQRDVQAILAHQKEANGSLAKHENRLILLE
jgi:hypothetical protein